MLIFMAMIMWLFYFFFNINFLESGEIMKINYFLVNENYLFKNLYMNNLMYLNLFMIFYLLLMMIISVLICLKLNIPLRQYCI
uniref:NADH dehydrogenase subunit 6 n=1 Tax=Sigalphus bicolor TaxID=515846 RepID=A0A0A6ZL31_9HYME|nr:NADH dehydrogenase subunit 6 [Sigalphus bicolor]